MVVLFCNLVAAQSFTASITKNPVEVGEQFQLTFSLNTSGSNFNTPGFPDFSVLSGPNQSTSMQFVNGSMSQSTSFSYYLAANKPGKFIIQGVSIEAKGKRITAAPITIEVVKGNANAGSNNQAQNNNQQGADLSKSVFLKATTNKTNVFQGEAVLLTYKLYTKIALVNYSISKMPAMDGFWSQDLPMPKELQFRQESINGVNYNVAEIKKMMLFPQRSGTLKIDPMEGECIARIQVQRGRSNDPWSQFFNDPFFGMGQQDVQQELKSEPVSIIVKEPSGTAPEAYTGAVGNFTFEAFLDKPETKTNEAVTLKVKVSGKGNLKLIDPPKTNLPPDIEAYDPKTADNFEVTAAGVSGSRTFEYLLLPRNVGEYKIPPIQFAYFDLSKRDWVTLSSKEFVLKVTQGAGAEASTTPTSKQTDLQLLGKDIRFIKTRSQDWQKEGTHFFTSILFFSLLLAPVFLLLAFLFYYSKNKELQGNLVLMRSRKATQMAKKRLKAAKICLEKKDKEHFYDEIFKALWGYTSDRLGIPVSALSKETAAAAWALKGIGDEHIQQLMATIDRCEFARFAPGGSGEMQQQYDETMSLISNLETALKGS